VGGAGLMKLHDGAAVVGLACMVISFQNSCLERAESKVLVSG
jgi:hypothetical protein